MRPAPPPRAYLRVIAPSREMVRKALAPRNSA